MEDDEGTAPRRERRRAVRPAGPVAGGATPALTGAVPENLVPEPAPAEKVTIDKSIPEASRDEGGVSGEAASHSPDSAEGPVGTESPDTTDGRKSGRRGLVSTALFVVVVLVLLAASVYLFLGIRSANADDARAERFVQTARQTVLNLTTIHPDSAQADVDRLLEGASGDFKAEFEGREGPFVEVVQQARVDSNGEIIEAGIESSGDGFAEVLVAARAMVQNSDAAEPQPRDFRLRIRVVDDDGVLTASRVEFVP